MHAPSLDLSQRDPLLALQLVGYRGEFYPRPSTQQLWDSTLPTLDLDLRRHADASGANCWVRVPPERHAHARRVFRLMGSSLCTTGYVQGMVYHYCVVASTWSRGPPAPRFVARALLLLQLRLRPYGPLSTSGSGVSVREVASLVPGRVRLAVLRHELVCSVLFNTRWLWVLFAQNSTEEALRSRCSHAVMELLVRHGRRAAVRLVAGACRLLQRELREQDLGPEGDAAVLDRLSSHKFSTVDFAHILGYAGRALA